MNRTETAVLKLTPISKRSGGPSILQDINIEVLQGSTFGLIGPNGAGKTTVFNLITGPLAPTGGLLAFNGDNLVGKKPYQIIRMDIARVLQNIHTFEEMTLLENVVADMHWYFDYGAPGLLLSLPKYRAAECRAHGRTLELFSWVKLDHKAHDITDNLSYGDQRKLELTQALAIEPKLLLLDEPAVGTNTGGKVGLMVEIEGTKACGHTISMTEYDMCFVMDLCECIAVLNFGRIIVEGPPEAVRNDPQIIEAYPGHDDDDGANDDAPREETV